MIVDALACYRLTRLVVEDGITADLRNAVWARHDPEESLLGYALTCPHCVSVWAAGAVLALRGRATRPVLYGLALSACVSLLDDLRAWAQVGVHTRDYGDQG